MPRKRKTGKRPRRPTKSELKADEAALDRLVTDPELISGIYNYCDRWCERCAFTARCLNFRMRAAQDGESEGGAKERDPNAFWGSVARSFALARRLIEREARKQGIDLETLKNDGSAKVALIAIDRSIGAWARLREQVSVEADTILDLLVRLEQLRRAAERKFPQARAFKRPGFDN